MNIQTSITDIRIAQLQEVVEYFKTLLNDPTKVYQNPKEYRIELYNMGFHIKEAIKLIKDLQEENKKLKADNQLFYQEMVQIKAKVRELKTIVNSIYGGKK